MDRASNPVPPSHDNTYCNYFDMPDTNWYAPYVEHGMIGRGGSSGLSWKSTAKTVKNPANACTATKKDGKTAAVDSDQPAWGTKDIANIPESVSPVWYGSQGAGGAFIGGLSGSAGGFKYSGVDGAIWSGKYNNISILIGATLSLNFGSGGASFGGVDTFFNAGNSVPFSLGVRGDAALVGGSIGFSGLVPSGIEGGIQPGAGFAGAVGRTRLHAGVLKFGGCWQ